MTSDATTAWFVELLADPEGLLLDEAALSIAAHAQPGLDIDARRVALDRLAVEVEEPTRAGLCRHLFEHVGFTGNAGDYYDPGNSLIDLVLERKTGNPITLSIIAIGVARRCGVTLAPIGMPGHFLVRDESDPEHYIDAFNGGAVLDTHGCRELLLRLAGPEVRFDPAFLLPTRPDHVVARMLNNLVAIYHRNGDGQNLAWAAVLRSHLEGAAHGGLDQVADVLGGAGRYRVAAQILDNLAGQNTASAGGENTSGAEFAERAQRYWARLN